MNQANEFPFNPCGTSEQTCLQLFNSQNSPPKSNGRQPGELALVIFTVDNHSLKLHVVHLVAQF